MQPYEIIAGPLTLWLAPVGTAFPALGAAPGAAWTKVGTSGDQNYSDDGVTVSHGQKIEEARPAGSTGPRKVWRVEEDFMVSVVLWDLTLEQYLFALNGNTVSTVAAGAGTPGYKTIGLSRGQDVATYALLARGGLSPYGDGYSLQYELPRCYQSGEPEVLFKKGAPAGLDLEFTGLEDPAAATVFERFGRLRAQHQAAV